MDFLAAYYCTTPLLNLPQLVSNFLQSDSSCIIIGLPCIVCCQLLSCFIFCIVWKSVFCNLESNFSYTVVHCVCCLVSCPAFYPSAALRLPPAASRRSCNNKIPRNRKSTFKNYKSESEIQIQIQSTNIDTNTFHPATRQQNPQKLSEIPTQLLSKITNTEKKYIYFHIYPNWYIQFETLWTPNQITLSKWRYRSSLECQRRKDEVKGLQLGSPKLLTINNSLQKCVSLFKKKHTCSMGSLFVTIVNHCHVLFQVTSLDAWKLAHCFS